MQYKCDGVQSGRTGTGSRDCSSQGRDLSRFQAYSSQVYFTTDNIPARTHTHTHTHTHTRARATVSRTYITVRRGLQRKHALAKIKSASGQQNGRRFLDNKMDDIVFSRPAGIAPTIFSTMTISI